MIRNLLACVRRSGDGRRRASPRFAAPAKSEAAASATLARVQPVREAEHAAVPDARFLEDQGQRLSARAARRNGAAEARSDRDRQQPGGADVRQYRCRDGALRASCSSAPASRSTRSMARTPTTRCRRPTPRPRRCSPRTTISSISTRSCSSASRYLHDHQAELNLNPEQAKLLDVYYKQFVHAGAELPPAKQAELKAINKRLSTLQTAVQPEAARRRQGGRAARRPTRRRSPACRRSSSPPRRKRRRTARSPAMCCRCRTRRSSRRWIR